VIVSFADRATERVWRRERVARLAGEVHRAAHRKLLQLDWAEALGDLRAPPGNRLEKLTGDRVGPHSIGVKDQYRICFVWTDAGPADV
jgi:proteic killer suppression protein